MSDRQMALCYILFFALIILLLHIQTCMYWKSAEEQPTPTETQTWDAGHVRLE